MNVAILAIGCLNLAATVTIGVALFVKGRQAEKKIGTIETGAQNALGRLKTALDGIEI